MRRSLRGPGLIGSLAAARPEIADKPLAGMEIAGYSGRIPWGGAYGLLPLLNARTEDTMPVRTHRRVRDRARRRCRPAGGVVAMWCPRCRHTPHITEQILAVRGAIEGERKQVSVLFCDIVASSASRKPSNTRARCSLPRSSCSRNQSRHWSTARSMPGTQAGPPQPKACSAAG